MKFNYSIIRYVPSVLRGEALNVGVALETDDGRRLVKFAGSLSRVRALFPDADTATVRLLRKHFRSIESADETSEPVFGYGADDASLQDLMVETRNTILQFTHPAVTVADDPVREIDNLYETFVAPRQATAARVFGSVQMAPARLRAQVVRRLDSSGLVGPGKLQTEYRVRGTVFPWEFDLGHSNGGVNLVQSIALDAPTDTAVSRALLLSARIADIKEAGRRVGNVLAVADRRDAAPEAVELLENHRIGVAEVTADDLADRAAELV